MPERLLPTRRIGLSWISGQRSNLIVGIGILEEVRLNAPCVTNRILKSITRPGGIEERIEIHRAAENAVLPSRQDGVILYMLQQDTQ